jgi:signal transduction histidine kinase
MHDQLTLPVAARLTLWMVAGMTAALGLSAAWLLASEREQLQAANARELRTLGGSAQVAITHALRDAQNVDVSRLLSRVEALDATTDILFIGRDGAIRAATPGDTGVAAVLVEVARRAAATGGEVWHRDGDRILAFALPLTDTVDGGAVLIVRRLDDLREDMERTLRAVVTTAVVAILLVASISVTLSVALVRRPLAATAVAMRRVRDGDLDAVVPVERRDELGAIAVEFNDLVQALRLARARLHEAEEQRRLLEQNLARADKLMTVGQLAAGLAHEIGTPLHVVAGRARRLVDHPDAPEEVVRLGRIVVEQTERIARIVEQLVRFARRPQPGHRPIDPRGPVEAVLSLLEGEAARARVAIVSALQPVPEVRVDPDQLQQVTLNLVRNGIAATPAGGTVTVRLEAAEDDGAPSVRLVVADTGTGIAVEDRERIFEPFFTTRHDSGGSGLGLAVVRSIVQEHRGTIHVDSTPGGGTTMIVSLPHSANARSPHAP